MNKQIFRLAVPSIVANITTPLLALVDTAVTGHMGSPMFLAAIAVGGTIFNMLYWLFGFLRAGTGGMTAQEFGGENHAEAVNILRRSLSVAAAIGLLIVLLQVPLLDFSLGLMDVDPDTRSLVRLYFGITVYGAPAVLAGYALAGWFIGMQNTRYPMWSSIVVNVTNIVTSVTAVYVLHMGLAGVAAGTLIAQWCGALMLLWLTRRYNVKLFGNTAGEPLFNPRAIRRFFNVNTDIFLRTLCLIAVTVWFTRQGAEQGVMMLAVNTLLMQFFIITSYVTDGFAFAAEAMTGKYVGQRNELMVRRTISRNMLWGCVVALSFTLLFLIGGDSFIRLLSDDAEVIAAAHPYRFWVMLIPVAGFAAFIWDGVFIGATRTRALLLSMGVAMVWFFGMHRLLAPSMGNNALWLAFVSYLAVRGLVLTAVYFLSSRAQVRREG
ncbi:MAG: MATE family efflux transporter [Muribaculaceae bacterium]|nr:MATE family efflux transporter [Muribaculaceae bacterium]